MVSAVVHSVDHSLIGIYNVCDSGKTPPTNQKVFDAICDMEGLERLDFLVPLKAPVRKISAEKIYASGYRVVHDKNDFGVGL